MKIVAKEDGVWLQFKNGSLNLEVVAEEHGSIFGRAMKAALKEFKEQAPVQPTEQKPVPPWYVSHSEHDNVKAERDSARKYIDQLKEERADFARVYRADKEKSIAHVKALEEERDVFAHKFLEEGKRADSAIEATEYFKELNGKQDRAIQSLRKRLGDIHNIINNP